MLVVYSDLVGEVQVEPYHELLSKPFVKSLSARSLRNPPPDLVNQTTAFVDEMRAIKRDRQETHSDFFTKMFRDRVKAVFITNRLQADSVAHCLNRAKILNCDPFEANIDFVKELNS